jgi:hypothetical protein
MSWEESLQSWGSTIIDKWSSKEFTQDYELQRLRLQALGQTGLYTEGQPVANLQNTVNAMGPMLVIGGVVLVAFLLLRKG